MTINILPIGQVSGDQFGGNARMNPDLTTALTFAMDAGRFTSLGSTLVVPAGTVTLANGTTNYVYVSSGVYAVGTTPPVTGTNAILYVVTTAASLITNIIDARGAIITNEDTFS